jgi:predicted ArsR family transcriptional regulator
MAEFNSSEQVLLNCMKDERTHSPRDLSIACCLNEPAVRYHLRKLTRLGIIQKYQDPDVSLKPGRKPDLYRLSSTTDIQTTLLLCRAILGHIGTVLPPENAAATLADWILQSLDKSALIRNLSIKELILWLGENHYAARWLAGRSGPELLISNCPYRDLKTESDLICHMDEAIFSKVTGLPWKKAGTGESATPHGTCRFVLDISTRNG